MDKHTHTGEQRERGGGREKGREGDGFIVGLEECKELSIRAISHNYPLPYNFITASVKTVMKKLHCIRIPK